MNFGRVLTAMVTPFTDEGELNYDEAARLADYLATHGSDGLVVCGTTGESPTLTWQEEYELFRVVRDAVAGRAKVIAGTGSNSTREAIEANELLEWAQYAGNFYGTPREIVFQKLNQGQDVLLEIELAGARQVRQQYPDAIRIFLCPPSLEELERRIRERGQDSEASIERRLEQARKELDAQDEFDYVIVNDNLEQALQELEALLYPPSPSSKEQQP